MIPTLEIRDIPQEHYSDYRYRVIFGGYKWDPQVEDHNTVAQSALLLERKLADQLGQWAEQLAAETVAMENALIHYPKLIKELGFPRKMYREFSRLKEYCPQNHVRLMRFDFHPTSEGWAISEVNSDVPGGLAEASVLPEIAMPYFPGYEPGPNVAQHLFHSFRHRLGEKACIAFVHATSYADDRQVMEFLGDYFAEGGMEVLMTAPDHLRWKEKQAISILEGHEEATTGIIRFFPLEWLGDLPRKSGWQGYYDTITPSCNPAAAILTQSKRLPLVWDQLGVDNSTWKALLPETKAPTRQIEQSPDWIYKPAFGRVGEGISIQEAISPKELQKIQKSVRAHPRHWVVQKRFESQPLKSLDHQESHLCLGVFTVDGRCAGFYARISPHPRIDAKARDIPVLISKEE